MARKVADCREMPSESGCTLMISGEEEEVVRAASEHAVSVHGHLTLGLVWGILQCGLFVASAWWYETQSTRSGDPLEESLAR